MNKEEFEQLEEGDFITSTAGHERVIYATEKKKGKTAKVLVVRIGQGHKFSIQSKYQRLIWGDLRFYTFRKKESHVATQLNA